MLTSREVAILDANAAAMGVSRRQLMESSGAAVAQAVRDLSAPTETVTVIAGRGNNGGDGFVAARFLDDRSVSVRLLGRPESIQTDIARANWDVLEAMEIDTATVPDSATLTLNDPDIIVDAMLGTGISGPLREPERSAAAAINDTEASVLAVDVPSGMDADTGQASGEQVEADEIVTFHERRIGLEGMENVRVADIGIPEEAALFTGPGDRQRLTRESDTHKGNNGEVLIIGGGPYVGAPVLAGQAALRAGADLVTLAVPSPIAQTVQGYAPDLIVRPYEAEYLTEAAVPNMLNAARSRDVCVIGPGLGDKKAVDEAVGAFLEQYNGRAVIDADALESIPTVDTAATLLCTPHRGELREMGGPSAEDWRERATAVADYATELGHTLLVKGQYDIISDGNTTRVNRTGTPGMTVGGTGDVLAGAAGALLAVIEPVEAGALAAFANGRAGEAVATDRSHGLVASDLLDALPAALWETHNE